MESTTFSASAAGNASGSGANRRTRTRRPASPTHYKRPISPPPTPRASTDNTLKQPLPFNGLAAPQTPRPAPDILPIVATRIGAWHIDPSKPLGAGSFSTVYNAYHDSGLKAVCKTTVFASSRRQARKQVGSPSCCAYTHLPDFESYPWFSGSVYCARLLRCLACPTRTS
jgi:hypothetical protein